MLQEAKGNELLYNMMRWFSLSYSVPHRHGILNVVHELRQKVSHYVRNPKLYVEEYKAAKKDWIGWGEHGMYFKLSKRELEKSFVEGFTEEVEVYYESGGEPDKGEIVRPHMSASIFFGLLTTS